MRSHASVLITLTLLLLLQNVHVLLFRPATVMAAISKRFSSRSLASPQVAPRSPDSGSRHEKRTISDGPGQAEEMLQHLGDQIESNYDEYPMVVPKRAELLIDRLMMSLHRALEKERQKSLEKERQSGRLPGISDFYMRNRDGNTLQDLENEKANHKGGVISEQDPNDIMYSDDDPSVMMDYDFKDLNSINRATGESLMTKSLQRRALRLDVSGDGGGGGGGEGPAGELALQRLSAMMVERDDPSDGKKSAGQSGRKYWRCYFNAVTCF